MIMAKKRITVKDKKTKRKEIMVKIITKISDALKEYATPVSERKIARKIKKASKELTTIIAKAMPESEKTETVNRI
jgi:hypothetical protein